MGLVLHLLISQVVGVTYAVFFRRRSFDAASGVGWGVSYGFLWWVLGNLTLLPVLLGADPQWSAAALAVAFPSLVGHLAYGAVLGLVYQRLEERVAPWHLTRSEAAAARAAARHEQTLSAAPRAVEPDHLRGVAHPHPGVVGGAPHSSGAGGMATRPTVFRAIRFRQALCFSSAAPKDTLKRSHQIVTVEYLFRSVPAGIA
ncbi:hypothetical protein WKI71_28740 [Streptomyces sp. MS1.AVA.1]|uniref:Uncharacterized protein n=1 Tax=Streptomyces machairae TaxID=3134109 RepID=A0ABU8UPX3_9ACTN